MTRFRIIALFALPFALCAALAFTRVDLGTTRDLHWVGSGTRFEARFGSATPAQSLGYVTFNGTSSYATWGGTDVLGGLHDFTLAFWLRVDSLGGTSGYSALLNQDGGNGGMLAWSDSFLLRIALDGNVAFDAHAPSYDVYLTNTVLTVGSWQHWAVVKSGASLLCYCDGVLVSEDYNAAWDYTEPSGGIWYAGDLHSQSWYLNGAIDEFCIFPRALNASEVADVASGLVDQSASPQLVHHFDDGSGVSAVDASTNAWTATLNDVGWETGHQVPP